MNKFDTLEPTAETGKISEAPEVAAALEGIRALVRPSVVTRLSSEAMKGLIQFARNLLPRVESEANQKSLKGTMEIVENLRRRMVRVGE